jgi:hypothetical protein
MLIVVPRTPRELKTMRLRMQQHTLLKQVRSDAPSGYESIHDQIKSSK